MIRSVSAALCTVIIVLLQVLVIPVHFPESVHAQTAGQDLSVRVQYFGERGDMIREKAVFSREDLENMGAQTWYYSNVTNVGTVMSMAARGPEVLTIIREAGIDPDSIKNITFRTTDGYTRNFTVAKHLSGGRFYYPYLSSLYERNDDGATLTPLEGALDDMQEVPSILALEFGATKAPAVQAETLSMGTRQTYRFCMGQTPLRVGQPTIEGYDGGDVSSMDSVHSIYGIDVTLSGSPVYGIGIDPVDSDMKVGSVTKLNIHIDGEELFSEDFGNAIGDLHWSSSDTSIAKVDQKGNVTILKKGKVTITVTADNGMSASVVINGTDDGSGTDEDDGNASAAGSDSNDDQDKKADKQKNKTKQDTRKDDREKDDKDNTKIAAGSDDDRDKDKEKEQEESKDPDEEIPESAGNKIHIRELALGKEILPEPPSDTDKRALDENTQVLQENRTYGEGTVAGAAGTAVAACGAGALMRFRRYRREFINGVNK